MKYCPNCQNNYPDDRLKFCLQDGTPLIEQTFSRTDIPTVTLQEQETVVASRRPDQITFDSGVDSQEQERSREENRDVRTTVVQPEPQKSNTTMVVLVTILLTLLLFGLAGVAAYMYLNNRNSEVVEKPNFTGNENNTEHLEDSVEDLNTNTASEIPIRKKTPMSEETSETPFPDIDVEEIKNDVSDRLSSWKSQTESLNIDDYMNSYADRVDYYNKNRVSKDFVRNDKQKAFSRYDSMKVNLSNISIIPNKDGRTAVAVFDKEWDFSGAGDNSSGKVRQQLKFRKSNDTWQITSEKDLKIYYVND